MKRRNRQMIGDRAIDAIPRAVAAGLAAGDNRARAIADVLAHAIHAWAADLTIVVSSE